MEVELGVRLLSKLWGELVGGRGGGDEAISF